MSIQNDTQRLAIQNLQRYLRTVALLENAFAPPPVDGVFESATEKALRDFQALYGLAVTGVANQETWERLYDAYRAAVALSALPQGVSLFPTHPNGYELPPESRGFAVAALQYMLRELEKNYEGIFVSEIDGYMGEQTQNAVRRFREQNRLPAGVGVDLLTWNSIADQYNALFQIYQNE